MKITMVTLLAAFCTPTVANGFYFCFQLDTSFIMSKPDKPMLPYCVNEYSGTHTCQGWEIDMYNSDVERYNNEVEQFIADLNNYIDEAVEYAQCLAKSLD